MRLGLVGRPHGTGGAFRVDDPTDRLTLLEPGRALDIGGERHEIVWRGGTAKRPLLRVAGVEDRDGAERLRGGCWRCRGPSSARWRRVSTSRGT